MVHPDALGLVAEARQRQIADKVRGLELEFTDRGVGEKGGVGQNKWEVVRGGGRRWEVEVSGGRCTNEQKTIKQTDQT